MQGDAGLHQNESRCEPKHDGPLCQLQSCLSFRLGDWPTISSVSMRWS